VLVWAAFISLAWLPVLEPVGSVRGKILVNQGGFVEMRGMSGGCGVGRLKCKGLSMQVWGTADEPRIVL
jgi:hypothetical protein